MTYDAAGPATLENHPARVRALVAPARSALLLVHGVISETREMATGLGPAGAGLARKPDIVLALDYENLDASIEVSGSDLATSLARVGISAQSGPRLTIVKHFTGGLVARCFVERQETPSPPCSDSPSTCPSRSAAPAPPSR